VKISPTCDDDSVVVGSCGEEAVDAVDGRKEGWSRAGEEEMNGKVKWARSAEESS